MTFLRSSIWSLAMLTGLTAGCNGSAGPGFGGEGNGEGGATGIDKTQAPEGLSCGKLAKPERVVLGYVPTYRNVEGLIESLDWDTLTHVAVAFVVPDGLGHVIFENEVSDATIHALVEKAHAKNVKVLVSLGGAYGSTAVKPELEGEKADVLVDELAVFVEKYAFDGVDVDIEGSNVDGTYGPFVKKLADKIRPDGKLVTAAVADNFAQRIDDATMWCFDFLNLMSYDYAGTWSEPGDHSSYSNAQTDLGYWVDSRGYAKERAVLGLPFYGYCWGEGCLCGDGPCGRNELFGFNHIAELYADRSADDHIAGDNFDIWYNGTKTIERKSSLGAAYGGIMIWDMGSDDDAQTLFAAVRSGLTE